MSSKKSLLKIGDLYSDSSHKRIAMCHSIFRKLKRKPTAGPEFLSQIIHWAKAAKKDGRESFYKKDEDWLKEINFPLRTLKRAKRIFKEENLVVITIKVINGEKVSFYQPNKKKLNLLEYEIVNPGSPPVTEIIENKVNNPENSKWHFAQLSGPLHHNPSGTFLCYNYPSGTFKSTQVALTYIDTINTTINTKINTYVFTKNELPPNQSGLGNLSNDQESGSEVDRSAFREGIILDQPPTPKNEESNLEEKAVEPPTIPLKSKDVKTPKKSKAKEKNKKHGSLTAEQQSQFEQLWNIWPKKFEKKASKKYFAQALEAGIEFSVLLSQATAYTQHEKDKNNGDEKYVLYLRTWLSDERWDDEYPTSAKASSVSQQDGAAAEQELPIDEKFKDFVSKYRDKDFYFRGAAFHEIRNDVLNIIQPHGEWRKDQLGRVDELKSWFEVKHVRVYAKVSDVPQPSNPNLLQAVVNTGESNELDKVLQEIGKGIKGKDRGMKVVSSNHEKSTSVSNPLLKPPYNSVKPMQHSEFEEKQIGSGKG